MAESTSVETEERLAPKFLKMSIPIEHGEPSVFALPLKKEADPSSLPKYHLGEENLGIPNKAIMVMGATGTGKTTFINGMVNYVLGIKWEDRFRFKLIREETERSQAQSQTSEVTAYVLNHQQGFQIPYSLTIVDTPGFGDTRGMECDKLITQKIRKLFTTPGAIDHIDSVCFVVKASSGRLTPTQKYVFDAVLSIFGKDIKDNIQVLVTFADGQNPPVLEAIKEADVPCAKDAKGAPVYFKFNNSALFASNAGECAGSFNFDEMFWKMGEMSMKTFFDSLNNLETKSLTLTKEVLRERKELETALEGLQAQIKMVLVKMEELKKTQEVLDLHKTDIDTNKDFEYEVEVMESVKEATEEYATNCRKCNFTCHYPCWKTWGFLIRFCTAMSFFSGTCNVCPGHCSVSNHFQEKYRLLNQVVKKTYTSKELKEKYEKSMKGKVTSEELLECLKAQEKMEKEILTGLIEKASQSYQRLQEIALNSSHCSTLEYIDLLIQEEKRERKPGYNERVLKLENMRGKTELVQKLASPDLLPTKREHLPEDKEKMKEIIEQFLKKP